LSLGGGGTGTSAGGSGTWDTTLTNWDSGPGAHVAWINASLNTAVFGGVASQTSVPVSLGTNITVGGLRFDTTDYVINSGANTLSFGTGNNTILFNNGIAAAAITGTVGGTGNVILSNTNFSTPGTLTFNGTSAGGWSGTTTINAGMTLATVSTAALTNKVLSSTTGGITLNGGTIQFTRASNSDIDAINGSAIGVNAGGTFSVTSSAGGASASETIGTVTVNSGQMNFVQTADNTNQLVLGGLSRGASTTSAVTFSAPTSFANTKFVVTGAGATTAGQIFAPWATTGTGAGTQTDYAVFNASNEVGSSGIAASAVTGWSTAHALGSNYNVAITAGTATSLNASKSINTFRKTGGAVQNVTSVASNIVTVTGSTYNNGDVVVVGNGANIGNLTREIGYYVVNAGVSGPGTFQLAATSGGTALTLGSSGGTLTGGMNLGAFNLETYGILNGSASPLGIGSSGGVLRTPTGGGSLYLTPGAGTIVINAPITNSSDSVAVTVVKNGSGGRLILAGNNTFTGGLVVNGGSAGSAVNLSGTQSFTGGITLNGGALGENSANSTPYTLAAALNGNPISVYGPSSLLVEGTLGTTSTIAIDSNAILKLGGGNGTITVSGVVSGSGVLDVNALNLNATETVNLTNTLNSFSGNVVYMENNGTRILNVNSIGDSGKVTFGLGTASQTFALNTGAAALTFNTRQFELAGIGAGGKISNNSANAFTINTDLLTTATGNRTLTFGGTGAGLGTFAGKLADGSLTSLAITKADASNTWTLTNSANSYTGGTSVSNGTLQLGANDVLGSGAVTVTGGTLQLSTFSDTVGLVTISGGAIDGSGVLSGSSVNATGASTISAILGGSGSLIKGVTGSTSLTKANTYSGGTIVTGGTLAVGASGVLGTNVSGNGISIRESGILTLAAAANSGSNQSITFTSSSTTDGRFGNLAVLGLGFNGLPAGAISQANTVGGVIAINAVTGYNTSLSTLLTGKNLFLGAIGTSTFTGAAGTVAAGNGSLYRLGGGGGTITFNTTNLFTSTNGVQAGSFLTNGGGTVVISESQNYSGATTVSAGTLTLSGANGAVAGSSSFTLNGGKLFLDSSSANNANRIGTVPVALSNGGELSLSGINTGSGTTETIGDLSIGIGSSTVTVKATSFSSTLAGGVFSRTNNGTALFRGTALGGSAAVMGKLTMSDVSTLTGSSFVGTTTLNNAGIADATKDLKIIPYLVGGTTDTDTGSTFVTYDTTLGFRALSTTNQFNATVTAGTNVRLTGAVTSIPTTSINSLIVGSANTSTIAEGNSLTVASGAVLFSAAGTIAPFTSTGTLNFGSAPGIITTPSNGVISAKITGSGGIVKSGTANLTLSSALNTYSGGTVVNAGTLVITADANLGDASGGITFNGTSGLSLDSGVILGSGRTLTINDGANVTFTQGSNGGKGIAGVLTGSGSITWGIVTDIWFSNVANTFNGVINATATGGGPGASSPGAYYGLSMSSIGDAAGAGAINLSSNSVFIWRGKSGTTTLTNRQFNILGSTTIVAAGGSGTLLTGTDWVHNPANNLIINTDLLVTNPGAKTLTLAGSNAGANIFAGNIADGVGSVISITKNDAAGNWILSGSNTYTGKTTINAGTLSINSIQNASSITGNSLGAPGLGTNSIIDLANTGTLRYIGTGHSSDRVINMTTTNGSTITLDASGSGTFALTGGLTTAGTSSTSTVVLTGTGLGSQSGSIINGTGTNVTALTKNGIGTWTLGGNNTYTGTTTLNAGTLKLDYATNDTSKLADINGILALNGGTLELSGGTHPEAVTSTTINTGGTFVKLTSRTAKLSMGAITFTGGAIDFAAGSIATTTTANITGGFLNLRATVAGANYASNDGSNNIVAYADASYTTFAGTLAANTLYKLAGSGTVAATQNQSTAGLRITTTADGQSLALANNVSLTNGSILFNGANNYSITTSGTGRIIPTALLNYGAGTLTLGSLGIELTQYGTGTTILSAAAGGDYGMTINGGTVSISTNAQIGTNASVKAITLNNGTLLASETLALDADGAGLRARTITLGAGGGTLAAASTKTLTASGVISGAGNQLTIGSATNTGTVVLSNAANSYTGGTVLKGGTASFVSGALGTSGNITFTGNSTLQWSGSNTQDVSSRIVMSNGVTSTFDTVTNNVTFTAGIGNSSTGALTKTGSGTLTLTGTNTYTGGTTLNNGTLTLGNVAALGAAGRSVALNGGTLDLHVDSSVNAYNVTVGGNVGIEVDRATSGNGIVNTFGTLGIGANTLSITANAAHNVLANTAYGVTFGATTLSGNAVFDVANNSSGIGTLTLGAVGETGSARSLTKQGAGKLTLASANTYTGTTTISLGTLQLSLAAANNTTILTDGITATTSDIVINGGTLELAASEQIADTGSINMSSGAFNFGAATGKTETIDKFTNSGGVFSTGANTLIGLGATITWSGGTNTINNGGSVQDAHIVISGGTNTVQAGGVLQLNASGLGLEMSNGATLTLNSDATTVGGKLLLTGNVSSSGDSTVTIAKSGINTFNGTVDLNGGTRTFTVANGTAATNMTIGAVITNGGLTKAGAGTLELTGTNTYTGATTVSNGTLIVNGSISTSTLTTVQSGATLAGGGTVGATTINGILAPGNSIGTLTATGDVTWNDNDAWVFELGSAASSLALADSTLGLSDLLNITGAGNDFLKGTGSTFTFDFAGGGTMGWYKVVDWDSASTTTFVGGDFYATNLSTGLTGTFTVDSGTSALYLNVVPEPNVAALLGGLGTLMLLRRRRS